MADEEKIFYPEVIQANPFPGQDGEPIVSNTLASVATSGGESVVTPKASREKRYPKALIAHETIGQALNTKARKILSDFELVDQGALRIGKFQPGVSGEIDLTPAGILALNQAGITTFGIDGETGNVTFLGEIQGGSININNQFSVDEDGNAIARSLAIVDSDFSNNTGVSQDISSTSYADITNTTVTLVIERPTIVLYQADIQAQIIQTPGAAGDWSARGIVRIRRNNPDNSTVEKSSMIINGERTGTTERGTLLRSTMPLHWLEVLQPATYTIKLVGKLEATTNNGVMRINDINFTVYTLGTFVQ